VVVMTRAMVRAWSAVQNPRGAAAAADVGHEVLELLTDAAFMVDQAATGVADVVPRAGEHGEALRQRLVYQQRQIRAVIDALQMIGGGQ
jgi:hypothetical protein